MTALASAATFLSDLRRQGITVVADGNELRCSAPRGVLTSEVLASIKERKTELLWHLRCPLSFAEERLWLLQQLNPGSTAYNLPMDIDLRGLLNVRALRESFATVTRRHDILRTRYRTSRGRPVPVVDPYHCPDLPLVDLGGLPPAHRAGAAGKVSRAEANRPFDLATGPAMRAVLVRLGPRWHRLMITRHHIASDGWSMGVLLRELSTLYRAHRSGVPHPLTPLPLQYRDAAAAQHKLVEHPEFTERLSRWVHRLNGAPPTLDLLYLPQAEPEPRLAGVVRSELEAPIVAGLRELTGRERVTPFSVLLTGLGLALSSMSGQHDLVIGCPVAGRNRPELDGLLGCFSSALPLRLDLSGQPSLGELLQRVHRSVLDVLDDADMPFERLVDALGAERVLLDNPLFQVTLAFQNVPTWEVDLPEVTASLEPPVPVAPKFALSLEVTEESGRWHLRLEFDRNRAADQTAVQVLERLREIVTSMVTESDQSVPRLLERNRAAASGSQPQVATPTASTCLHTLFETVASMTPDAVAVSCKGRQVSYRALAQRSARLATELRAHGVGPETVVAVHVDRGVELVVALLGVARAGGACLPLSPAAPLAQPAATAAGSIARVLLTGSGPREAVSNHLIMSAPEIAVVHLDTPDEWITTSTAACPAAVGANLAHVGSSGEAAPAALTTYENLMCLLTGWRQAVPALGRTQVWSMTSPPDSLDLALQVWGALTSGARLAIPGPGTSAASDAMWRHVVTDRITVLNQTPTALNQLLPAAGRRVEDCALSVVIAHGEPDRTGRLHGWPHGPAAGRVAVIRAHRIAATAMDVMWRQLAPDGGSGRGSAPMGTPLPGQVAVAVDAWGGPLPEGGQGELAVGGTGLVRGFLGPPSRTAWWIRPVALSLRLGARLLRSGELVRVLAGGQLGYRGRLDRPTLRGYRVDLGEIEDAMLAHPSVLAGAAVARRRNGSAFVAGYIVAAEGFPVGMQDLREFLAERLPRHLVPSVLVTVGQLPMTSTGRLDEAALPDPADLSSRPAESRPRTPTERTLATILAKLRRMPSGEAIGLHDNFFDLGGDSLLVTQFQARLVETFRIVVPARRIHQALDIASLARTVDEFRIRAEQDAIREALAEIEASDDAPDGTGPSHHSRR